MIKFLVRSLTEGNEENEEDEKEGFVQFMSPWFSPLPSVEKIGWLGCELSWLEPRHHKSE
jgi:hypothetical protein